MSECNCTNCKCRGGYPPPPASRNETAGTLPAKRIGEPRPILLGAELRNHIEFGPQRVPPTNAFQLDRMREIHATATGCVFGVVDLCGHRYTVTVSAE